MIGPAWKTLSMRWGYVGYRVAFYLSLSLLLVTVLTGGVLFSGHEYLVHISSPQAVIILIGSVTIVALFSKVITASFIKPLANLNEAVDQFAKRNWRTPIPVQGQDDLSRLTIAVNQMADALNQREARLSRGNRDLFILHTAGLNLMESLDLDALLKKIAARASDLVMADTTTVSMVDSATRGLRYLGAEGSKARMLLELDPPLEAGGIFNWIASYGTPLLIQDAQTDFRLDNEQMAAINIETLMSVPLWSSDSMIAVLTAVNKKGGVVFDKQDLRKFTVFANLAGAALQNAFLYADLKQKVQELHAAQQQLIHSTKLAAIGELATNVAHEINNPLTSVLVCTSHLLKSTDLSDSARENLRQMEQETLRVRKIIRSLLDFSHQRPPVMRPGDVMEPLRETVSLLQEVADQSGVHIRQDYPPERIAVNMASNELKQVFLNIMTNALHSMPQGGDLKIIVQRTLDDRVSIIIADTGHGISREHLPRIFEPFFTTKNSGEGTGLGLSISQRIVQNHGGRIEVSSEEGRGSRFQLYFPILDQKVVSD